MYKYIVYMFMFAAPLHTYILSLFFFLLVSFDSFKVLFVCHFWFISNLSDSSYTQMRALHPPTLPMVHTQRFSDALLFYCYSYCDDDMVCSMYIVHTVVHIIIYSCLNKSHTNIIE